MGKINFNEISAEKRSELIEQARVARRAKIEAGKNLRQNWADEPLWTWMRSQLKIKAPQSYIPATETKYVSRTLKKIGKDSVWWKEHFACSVPQWCEWNPNVPAYVLQGLMLEAAYPELVAKFRVE